MHGIKRSSIPQYAKFKVAWSWGKDESTEFAVYFKATKNDIATRILDPQDILIQL
jgi:hypothetical protein